VYSALGADFSALMRYINSRFTYLLTRCKWIWHLWHEMVFYVLMCH